MRNYLMYFFLLIVLVIISVAIIWCYGLMVKVLGNYLMKLLSGWCLWRRSFTHACFTWSPLHLIFSWYPFFLSPISRLLPTSSPLQHHGWSPLSPRSLATTRVGVSDAMFGHREGDQDVTVEELVRANIEVLRWWTCWPRRVTRANSTNVLNEGLRIREIGRQMNSKVRLVETGVYQK
jgi:hypothetical protein